MGRWQIVREFEEGGEIYSDRKWIPGPGEYGNMFTRRVKVKEPTVRLTPRWLPEAPKYETPAAGPVDLDDIQPGMSEAKQKAVLARMAQIRREQNA